VDIGASQTPASQTQTLPAIAVLRSIGGADIEEK